MTSLINPNDDEIKQKIIKCYDIIYNNDIKQKLIGVVYRYSNNYKNLNIDKNDLIDYLNLQNLNNVFQRLNERYNQSKNDVNNFNEFISNLMINTKDTRDYLFQYNCYEICYEEKVRDEYKFIYYNIKKIKDYIEDVKNDNELLKNSNKILNDDNEFLKNSIEDIKNDNENLNKTIKDMKYTIEELKDNNDYDFIKKLDKSNQILKNSIKDLKNENKIFMIINLSLFIFNIYLKFK